MTYECSVDEHSPHSRGVGKPQIKKCKYCGGKLLVFTGLWGVFTWTEMNRYPRVNAKKIFINLKRAEDYAKTEGRDTLVVRWIPENAL
jgi:hypothetical protein